MAMAALCLVSALRFAAADEEIKAVITADPGKMSEAGQAKFIFEISNYSEYQISGISIIDFDGVAHEVELGVDEFVAPNGSLKTELLLYVPEGRLGAPLEFVVTCIRSGEPVTVNASVTIERTADPVITVERAASAAMVRQGDSVTITYTLKNETKFDMTDITMIDEGVSDTAIMKESLLRSNDTLTRTTTIPMGADDIVSAPVVTYTVNGKAKSFSGLAEVRITAVLVKLAMKIDAGLPTSDGVVFTVEVKNTGNQPVRDIAVTDERGNAVTDAAFSLAAGESNTFSYTVVPLMTEAVRNVGFSLKGTDSLDQEYTLTAQDTYAVYPFVDESQIKVTLKAETVTAWTSDSDALTMRITIVNNSAVELRNVAVSESILGVIKTFDILQTGETLFDQTVQLGSPRNLTFTVKGNDPTGTSRELATGTLPVAYGTEAASPAPEETPAVANNTNAFGFLSTTIAKVLLVLGILMVAAFVVLIVLTFAERRVGGGFADDEDGDDDEDAYDEFDEFFGADDTGRSRSGGERSRDEYYAKRSGASRQRAYGEAEDDYSRSDARPRRQDSGRRGDYGDGSGERLRYRYDDADANGATEADDARRYTYSGRRAAERTVTASDTPDDRRGYDGQAERRSTRTDSGRRYGDDAAQYRESDGAAQARPVTVEYDAPAAAPALPAGPAVPQAPYAAAYPNENAHGSTPDGTAAGAAKPPKVIAARPQPAVQPVSRNTVKHVKKAPKDKR